jgi:outer membrane receptor for ferrienterochelin and colicins
LKCDPPSLQDYYPTPKKIHCNTYTMRYFLCFLLVTTAYCADAQTVKVMPPDTLADQATREVVITAQFAPTDVRQTVNTVRLIDQKTIERRAALNVQELLAFDPNIRLTQDPSLGSAVSINGMRGENVKILVDGVPVVGRLNGSVDAGQLPVSTVQQIEIIEGAQSLLYGSEASAGVINLVSRRSQLRRLEAEANPQWESNGFKNMQGRVGIRMGKKEQLFVQLTGNRLDFRPEPDTSQGRDQLWNPKTQRAGRAMIRYAPSERFELRITGGQFNEVVENLGKLIRPNFKPYAFDDYYHTNRTDATVHAEGWLPRRWFYQATAGWNRFDRLKEAWRYNFEEQNHLPVEGQQDTAAATGWLTRFTLASDQRDRRLNYLLGMENYAESATGIRIVDSTLNNPGYARGNDFAVFGALKYALFDQKLILQGGARWTQNRLYGAAVTPSLWVKWQPIETVQARLTYANGFRSPGLKELYFNFIDINHYLVGNTDLKPERSNNFRADIQWNPTWANRDRTRFVVNASGFHNEVRDRIILSEFAPVQYRYVNLSRWQTTGGGLGVLMTQGNWLRFRSDVVVTGFFNAFSEEIDSLPRLKWSPDWTNDLTLSCFDQRVNFNIVHKRTGATPYFFEEEGRVIQGETGAWNLLNASLGTTLREGALHLNIGVKNLLDTRQIRAGASGEPGHNDGGMRPVHWGRTFFVAVRVRAWSPE